MELGLYVIDGVLKGKRFKLAHGQILGRIKADISLKDPKISTRHARVVKDGDLFILLDAGSSNGIKVDGQKKPEVYLKEGVIIQLGDSYLQVLPYKKSLKKDDNKQQIKIDLGTWQERLTSFITGTVEKIKNKKKAISPLNHLLRLNIFRGVQLDTVWYMGYGPRQVGSKSMDFPIYEKDAPEVCFEIIPTPKGSQFKTTNPKKVLINDKAMAAKRSSWHLQVSHEPLYVL